MNADLLFGMATSKPRDITDDFADYLRPDFQGKLEELVRQLVRLTKTHAGKPLPAIQRAVTSTARNVGVPLNPATVEKLVARIRLQELP